MNFFISAQFLKFLLAGGIAATVNFFSRIVYNEVMSFSIAIILAYITGMVTAFLLNSLFVFVGKHRAINREIVFFVLINIAAVLQTWLISMFLYIYILPDLLDVYQKEVAHLVGIVFPVFTSFVGHKYITFRHTEI